MTAAAQPGTPATTPQPQPAAVAPAAPVAQPAAAAPAPVQQATPTAWTPALFAQFQSLEIKLKKGQQLTPAETLQLNAFRLAAQTQPPTLTHKAVQYLHRLPTLTEAVVAGGIGYVALSWYTDTGPFQQQATPTAAPAAPTDDVMFGE